ncbi:MAG: hypothetical protein GY791_12655 [Alphaproteobacteria bacterium]|nr:hypothetical protein [Alphaproteobacteria bacterium]
MTIDVSIERLVLDGLSRRDGKQIVTAIERQLQHLVATRGLPPTPDREITARHIDAGTVAAAGTGEARHIGDRLAHAIYRGAGG